jgi:hypothetical protein
MHGLPAVPGKPASVRRSAANRGAICSAIIGIRPDLATVGPEPGAKTDRPRGRIGRPLPDIDRGRRSDYGPPARA